MSECMATTFKVLRSVINDSDCSRNICTGLVSVCIECKLILKSVRTYRNVLSAGIDTLGACYVTKTFPAPPAIPNEGGHHIIRVFST